MITALGVASRASLTWLPALSLLCGLAAALGWVAGRASSRVERQRLRHQAGRDALTGLANRAGLAQALFDAATSAPAGDPVALVVDLDGFKSVNDRYGHAAGDVVLVRTAERLHGCLRDTGMRVVAVARLGGDEFAVLVVSPAEAGLTAAGRIAASMHRALRRPHPVPAEGARRGGAAEVVVGASIGVAVGGPGARDSWSGLLAAADSSMYVAKRSGGGWAWAGSVGASSAQSAHPIAPTEPTTGRIAGAGAGAGSLAEAGRQVAAMIGDRWDLGPAAGDLVA